MGISFGNFSLLHVKGSMHIVVRNLFWHKIPFAVKEVTQKIVKDGISKKSLLMWIKKKKKTMREN